MRANVIQSRTPPSLIPFIYSARDLGNIQFRLKNKTMKGIIYQSGYQKRGQRPASSWHHVAFSRGPYVNPEALCWQSLLIRSASEPTRKTSLGKQERVWFEYVRSFEESSSWCRSLSGIKAIWTGHVFFSPQRENGTDLGAKRCAGLHQWWSSGSGFIKGQTCRLLDEDTPFYALQA